MRTKWLACAISVLFVGAGVVSALNNDVVQKVVNEKPKGLLVPGHIAYGFASGYPYSGFTEFYLDDPGNLTISNGSGVVFISGAEFDPEGNMYCVAYAGGLYYMDMTSGVMTYIANTIPLNGLTYDVTTDTWYASSDDNGLFTIDITTGATTLVGYYGTSNMIIGLACDNDGNIYGYDVLFSGDSHLYSIDKNTGEATDIGDMGYGFLYAQDPAYDRDDSILYIAGTFNDGNPSALLTCDTQTGACTIVGDFEYGVSFNGFAIPFGPNQYPYAEFTWTPHDPAQGDIILFNASTSYDPDGYIILYEWDWNNDGMYEESSTNPTATHSWDPPGGYIVTLRVTDNTGLTGRKSKTINIGNHPPSGPGVDGPSNGTVNHEYTFSVGPITDPEDDSVYCYFDWGDGNNTGWLGPYSSGQIIHASHTWTQPGVYMIRAKLKDTYGAETVWSDPHPITITDNSPPSPPSITGAAKGKPGVSYLYTVQTTDPENDSLYYYVDWGDNTTSGWLGPYVSDTAIYVTHTWITKGLFNVTAKAKDTLDAESDWGTLSVTIPSMLYDIPVWSFFQWFIMQFPHAFSILRNLLDWLYIIDGGR